MYNVLVASQSFGYGGNKNDILNMFKEHGYIPNFRTVEESGSQIANYEAVIIGTEKFTSELFDKAIKLKMIIKYGVGTDNIDINAAKKHNINVLNLPGINSNAVVEMALGLIFAFARKIVVGDRLLRNEKCKRPIGLPVYKKHLEL